MGPVKLPPDFDLQGPNAAAEWKFWKTAFEDYLAATGQHAAADKIKLSILRNIIGTDSARIMATFTVPEDEENKYEFMVKLIDKYVNPRVNECFERYNFLKRVQKEEESFEHFLTACRHLVKTCNYNIIDPDQTAEDKALRDKIVMGIQDSVTREALLRVDQLSLEKAIQFCRTSEQSKAQNLQFQQSCSINFTRKKKKSRATNGAKYTGRSSSTKEADRRHGQDEKFNCRRCQSVHGPRECPAFGKPCKKCGRLNHFAVSCRVSNARNVRHVEQDYSSDESGTSDIFVRNIDSNNKCTCSRLNCVHKNDMWNESIIIEDKKIQIKLDTGADVNVMPLEIFKLVNRQFKIRPIHYMLKALEGTQVESLGIVNLGCRYRNRESYEDFVIVKGANQVLLSGQACLNLKLIKRISNVIKVDTASSEKEQFIALNAEIFEGHGKFPGKFKITTVEDFEAVGYPPTKIPIAIRDPVKKELDRLVARNAIVEVHTIDNRASINRMVIVEKQNGKIRLCLDPSDLNKQIIRKPRLIPTIDEVCSKLSEKKFFTVFDLSEGYHHLALDEESSWKCCFSTPFGTYRYLVLPYGLSSSQDLFQEVVENNFGNIENVIVFHDDMIVSGKTKEEHDSAVNKIIERAKQSGAKFNKEKFQYSQKQVKFMGQIFSDKGMEIDPERALTLGKLESPKSKCELQRIIGSFNYVRRYVPNMANYMQPLCELLKSNIEWQWLPKHQEAFENLKKIISQTPTLVPFDVTKKVVIQCDASKNGLGCCLFQEHENNILKLVSCASRKMNHHEINYSQSEKEMLAIYYSTQKFHNFIYNAVVDVQTDHKPLIAIMKKPICKIGSVRLQRLKLKLLKYTLNVYYVPGKNIHFADMLSRSDVNKSESDPEMFDMVHYISKHLPLSEERKNELRSETFKDDTLIQISRYYYEGWPKVQKIPTSCKPFYKFKESIYVEAGIIFVDDKIIVPSGLRLNIIKKLHKGHIGVSKTINKARSLFFWPNLSTDIFNYIKQCRTCEKFMPRNFREPMLPHQVPKLRFNKLSTDILEFGAKSYLVVIDHFSHWIDISLLRDKTSDAVINAFQNLFTKFGYPEHLVADNLPFVSVKCKNFYRNKDISIVTCSPHYHQSNGLAEKAVNIVKQILRKSSEENSDYRELVMEYNNTAITNLGASPAQILQSRSLRTQLPVASNMLEPTVQYQIYKRLCEQKMLTKLHYDKTTRRAATHFQKGDRVVIKCNNERIWQQAIVIEKAKEPRSYWVRKECNNKIVRRNSNQMKLSRTNVSNHERILEPELHPDELPIIRDRYNVPQNQNHINQEENHDEQLHVPPTQTCATNTSRTGRTIKPPSRLNL